MDDQQTKSPEDTEGPRPIDDGAEHGDDVGSVSSRVEEIQARLEQETAQATDYMHRWQRVSADFANYRRRTEQERDELVKLANRSLIDQLLSVLDNFDRAFTSIPRELRSLSWIDGVSLIYQQMYGVLMQQGLEPILPKENDRFDAAIHEAIAYEPADGKEDGTILRVFQTGYRLSGRLVRPSLVMVAQGAKTSDSSTVSAPDIVNADFVDTKIVDEATPAKGSESEQAAGEESVP